MRNLTAVGRIGVLAVATRGAAGAGEVLLSLRGGTESLLAWSDEPLAKGTRVMVIVVIASRVVRVVIVFKVGNDPESIVNAGQRFLSDQSQMSVLTARIFAGHLRSIIGSMNVEEIITERQKLAAEVLDGSKEEMAKIGLAADALQIQSIDDGDLGYIAALSAPHTAAVAAGADRAVAGPAGGCRGRAAVAAQAGRVRPGDRDRAGSVPGRGRAGAGRRWPGRATRASSGAAGGHRRADRARPA